MYCNSNNHDFKKKHIALIIRYVNYNKHRDLENYYQEQLLLFHPFITLEESQFGNHESWHDAYNTYESLINDVCLKFIYKFLKIVHGLENWENLELHAHDLTQINNDSIWMDKFDSVNEKNSSKPLINCIEIEHYDIGFEFHVKAQCTLSIILCTIERKDELIPNEKNYPQLQKLNKKQCAIFDDYMYRKKCIESTNTFIPHSRSKYW